MIFLGVCLCIVGAGLTYAWREHLILRWRSRHWPSTVGNICGRVEHAREIDWVYAFKVADRLYVSSRFDFSESGWEENDRYPEHGSEVKVYYCPSEPSVAVLRRRLPLVALLGPYVIVCGVAVQAIESVIISVCTALTAAICWNLATKFKTTKIIPKKLQLKKLHFSQLDFTERFGDDRALYGPRFYSSLGHRL